MKFANLTLALLIGASLAGLPRVVSAVGLGLFDLHSGCAQKGACQKGACQKGHVKKGHKGHVVQKGHPVQKGHVVQKGRPIQKGHVVQKGHVAQKGSKCGCGSCNLCLPRVLPILLNGIDGVLNQVFSCGSCGSSKGCGAHQKGCHQKGHVHKKGVHQKGAHQKGVHQKGCVAQKSKGCGCSSGRPVGAPSDPFVDDELQPPPIPEADARNYDLWHLPKPVSRRINRRPTQAVVTTASTSTKREPRALPIEKAEPISEPAAKAVPMPAPVRRVSNQTSSGLQIPKNPLR